ncbi:AraC-type DNA-binding protein [Chryseolinea serpens]|uniref:AraC-type DNA-binding protein n=1 Tax=Chryseolinea serpens TaxID=947013 RepID=A0A1M5QW53_9BACT|nr:response regulator transcription factor [Chryseolinea serpens]SHH18198.1 AraC-type DNA-binding protein [Chryseolinea serpens]
MKNNASAVSDFNAELKLKGFKAYEVDSKAAGHNYSRKDFYKISLTSGKFVFHYADRSFETDEPILFFGNPRIPYSCEIVKPTPDGYACLFTEDFLKLSERSESLLQSPLFKIGGTPILKLDKKQKGTIAAIFQKMIVDQDSTYAYKDELIRNYINLIIHEALKMQPSENVAGEKNAAQRITSVFLELLERQFPIESTERPLQLKTAQDFAQNLAVHVNHLNSSVKEVTGKPTTAHIADRIISEAKALLQHTDWSVTEIAYALGFEYPTYFNNFFKKKTGQIPKAIRAMHL